MWERREISWRGARINIQRVYLYVYLKHRAREYFSMDSSFLLYKSVEERETENILYIINPPSEKAGVGVASSNDRPARRRRYFLLRASYLGRSRKPRGF